MSPLAVGSTTNLSAGNPITFTVGVGTTSNIRDVTIAFGDGTSQSLGAISGNTSIQHTYDEEGSYTVRVTATEASGFTEQVSTSITILPGQPPAVTITASEQQPECRRNRHLHRDGLGRDVDDPALRVELRQGRRPADSVNHRQSRDSQLH